MSAPENRAKQASKRNATTWKKGCASPNPGGRPGGYAEFREACREHSPEAVKMLANAVKTGDVQAARVLLEYAWGKPASAPEDLQAVREASPLAGLSLEELMALVTRAEE